MPSDAYTCAVCHQRRTHGSLDGTRRIFICEACQDDAQQFLAIQEAIWGSPRQTPESADDRSGEGQLPTDP